MNSSLSSDYPNTGIRAEHGEKGDGKRTDKPPETPRTKISAEEDIGQKRDGKENNPVSRHPLIF